MRASGRQRVRVSNRPESPLFRISPSSTPDLLITVKGIGESKANAWPRQAAVQKSGIPLLLEPWDPPDVDFEVSYDIEDFTPDPFVYLHGLLIRQGSALKYGDPGFSDKDWGSFEPVFAGQPSLSRICGSGFSARSSEFEERGEYVVYVYSSHEKTTLDRLAKKYGGSTEVEVFINRFVDLMPVAKRSVVFPTERYGLKNLARFVGFDWRDEDPGGAQSMAWWAEYQADPASNTSLRDRILVTTRMTSGPRLPFVTGSTSFRPNRESDWIATV